MTIRRPGPLISAALLAALALLACTDAPGEPSPAAETPTAAAPDSAPTATPTPAATPAPTPTATPAPTATTAPTPTQPPCDHREGTLTGDTTVGGSWVEMCEGWTTDGVISMFHYFRLSARGMVTIALASAARDAELVLRKGPGRAGTALEEGAARVRRPLDAGAYTVEARAMSGAAGPYALAIGLVPTPTMSYRAFDARGEAATPARYSILAGDEGSRRAATTYEELRKSASALRLNLVDTSGVSHDAFFATVEVGDVVEWHRADDCWTRYVVTSAPAPAPGATSREFGVRWVTYAYHGCSGDLPVSLAATVSWHPPDISTGSPAAATPIRHGPSLVIPDGWSGALEDPELVGPRPATPVESMGTESLDVARTYPHWREPKLPEGWTFWRADAGDGHVAPEYGYQADYVDGTGSLAVRILVTPAYGTTYHLSGTRELRIIDGHPADVRYGPPRVFVYIHDESARLNYIVHHWSFTTDIDAIVAIARSLYRQPAQ